MIPTYGSDTVIKAPGAKLNQINDRVMEILFQADALEGADRDRVVIEQLNQLNQLCQP